MNEETPSPEQNENQRPMGPSHSPRAWRNCCLVPSIALALVLVIVGIASLSSYVKRETGTISSPGVGQKATNDVQKRAFINFANDYFSIARDADEKSKNAFRMLRQTVTHKASVQQMQDAFQLAARANSDAAAKYRSLSIPANLASQDKLRRSTTTMSQAYKSRQTACEILATWNGDPKDNLTKNRYLEEADQVEKLTEASLGDFLEAAADNGLTRDDLRELVTQRSLIL